MHAAVGHAVLVSLFRDQERRKGINYMCMSVFMGM